MRAQGVSSQLLRKSRQKKKFKSMLNVRTSFPRS
nr:MAG TPA: hypothetical protein [Caudoviricetes sp.]